MHKITNKDFINFIQNLYPETNYYDWVLTEKNKISDLSGTSTFSNKEIQKEIVILETMGQLFLGNTNSTNNVPFVFKTEINHKSNYLFENNGFSFALFKDIDDEIWWCVFVKNEENDRFFESFSDDVNDLKELLKAEPLITEIAPPSYIVELDDAYTLVSSLVKKGFIYDPSFLPKDFHFFDF